MFFAVFKFWSFRLGCFNLKESWGHIWKQNNILTHFKVPKYEKIRSLYFASIWIQIAVTAFEFCLRPIRLIINISYLFSHSIADVWKKSEFYAKEINEDCFQNFHYSENFSSKVNVLDTECYQNTKTDPKFSGDSLRAKLDLGMVVFLIENFTNC